MLLVAYAVATLAGLATWVPSVRLYTEARRMRTLRWAMSAWLVVPYLSIFLIAAEAIAVARLGLVGAPVGLAVVGLISLFMAAGAWWQAKITQILDSKMDALLAENPDLKQRFRSHWFFKRMLSKKLEE